MEFSQHMVWLNFLLSSTFDLPNRFSTHDNGISDIVLATKDYISSCRVHCDTFKIFNHSTPKGDKKDATKWFRTEAMDCLAAGVSLDLQAL